METAIPGSEIATLRQADDRVLGATRWAARVVAVVLAAAGVILYAFPSRTGLLWAWEMAPDMNAVAVGAGYLAGAVFFLRALCATRWHAIGVTYLAASVLTALLLVATVLHWGAFNHRHASFWTWTVVYVAAPVVLPLLWWRNRRHDPGDAVDTAIVPAPIRAVAAAVGSLQTGAALAFFVHPPLAMAWWPWTLSPLTTRTLSAFIAFIGVMLLAFGWEERWSALRLHVQSATLGLVLVGIGALRTPADIVGTASAVAGVFGLLTVTVAALVALQLFMRGRPCVVRAAGDALTDGDLASKQHRRRARRPGGERRGGGVR